MITGVLNNWRNQFFVKSNPIWGEVFQWLQANMNLLKIGYYELPFGGCFVQVMSYDLKKRDEIKFESHINHVDLQVTLENAEGIEWHPSSNLVKNGEYDKKNDFQFYHTPDETFGWIENRVGLYTILFPDDAHQPQRIVDNFTSVKKLVVKIPVKNFIDDQNI